MHYYIIIPIYKKDQLQEEYLGHENQKGSSEGKERR